MNTTPVPSIGSIADRDQVTAQALVAAGEHIAADGGLLDPMGLWAVDPAACSSWASWRVSRIAWRPMTCVRTSRRPSPSVPRT